ncbi:hypothetical protein LGK95_20600 [Clostridium algoriphilum]|uniref:hypothetical protein n=1 Tax=Clostridium algoriphilum TaxID=198347 RepID=UPI001CF39965|nr:hypothetical protein [Clostridium algoriphilum]MCB2295866.1 hypothetical protein [Clostridium algoriphilum]
MNKFQKKVEDVMESIEESNSFKCETRIDLKIVAKALVKTNGTIPDFKKYNLASKHWKSAKKFIV